MSSLLECPREDLIVEMKQFFTNTWRRHGSGDRPDAPAQRSIQETVKVVPTEVLSKHNSTIAHKKLSGSSTTCTDPDSLTTNNQNYPDPTIQLLKTANAQYLSSPRTVNSAAYPTQSQKCYAMNANTKASGKLEKDNISGGSLLGERNQRISKSHSGTSDKNGQNRLQFARTNSSPELTDPLVQSFPSSRRPGVVEREYSSKVEYISNNDRKSCQEKDVPSMNASSNSSVVVSYPSGVSSSNHKDSCFATNDELSLVSSDIIHNRNPGEHDLIDDFNGQVPLPVQIQSHHSVVSPPIMVSSGFPQRNLARMLPPNFPFIGSPWLHNMQFVHGFVPPPMAHFVGSPTFAANSDDSNESERSIATDINGDDVGNWHENGTALYGNLNQERGDPEIFSFKDLSSSMHDVPYAHFHGQSKFGTEDNGKILREKFSDMFCHQVNGGIRFDASNMTLVSSQARSGHTTPDTSCDELTEEGGKTHVIVAPLYSFHSRAKTNWQLKNVTECIPSGLDGTRNRNAIPVARSEFSDEIAGPSPSAQSSSSPVSEDHDPLQINTCSPVFGPFLIGPQQRQVESSGLTFVPTGPPVPFVLYPVMPGNNDSSLSPFERSKEKDQFPADMAFQNFSLHDYADQRDANSRTPSGNVVADHDHKSDILHSDFSSHWHNLQYGRFCQNVRPPAPVLYPVAIPPLYLPAHFPLDGPGRRAAHGFNWAQVRGPG